MSMLRLLSWSTLCIIAFALLVQPISVQAQLVSSLTIIVALALLWRFTQGPLSRQLFITLAGFAVVRYIYWRITCTLPPASDPLDLLFGLALLASELYCVVILFISLVVNADPLKRPAVRKVDEADLPFVDVLVPTYNEDEYLLATTIAAAKSMDYPPDRLNVWLLDDGGTEQKRNDADPVAAESARARHAALQALCASLGAFYLTRQKNEHAKAGNLNNALVHLTGDIVVVFDADHAPFRSFLRETVGYFLDDPDLFLVQTPHVFLNPDPIEKNLRTFRRMPSENEMFYALTQRGLDKWDASFFCGSAALLRRKALEEAGGFSGVTITEDCETAFELHAHGWSSVYVDKPLIAGLQPETFASFIGQRVRWCQGMLQILVLKNPLFKRGLKPIQRLGYLSSMSFWFFPFPRLVFMLSPLAYILFDIKIVVSNVDEAIAYTATYIVVNVMLQNYLFGAVRWPWVSELYEYCQGVFLSKATLSVVLDPRRPTFNVTAKGVSLDSDRLSELAWPFFAIYAVLAAAAAVAAYRYAVEPGVDGLMLIVGVWNGFNLIMAGVALGAVAERRQPDRHPHLAVDRRGALEIGGERALVAIDDVSVGGCRLRVLGQTPTALQTARDIEAKLTIEPIGDRAEGLGLPLRIKGTAHDGAYGCEFGAMQPEDYFVLVDLMYGDPQALTRFLAARRQHKNIFVGTAQFLWWGLVEPIRALVYALKRSPDAAPPQSVAPEPSTLWLRRLLARAGARGSEADESLDPKVAKEA